MKKNKIANKSEKAESGRKEYTINISRAEFRTLNISVLAKSEAEALKLVKEHDSDECYAKYWKKEIPIIKASYKTIDK